MSGTPTTSNQRGDSFLSSRGIDQSTAIMVGGILVVAFVLLTFLGREPTNLTPPETDDASLTQTVAPTTDIAGSGVAVTTSDRAASD